MNKRIKNPLTCWVCVDTLKVGTWKQAEALADKWLGKNKNIFFEKKPIKLSAWCRWMPPAVFLRLPDFFKKKSIQHLKGPIPDVIIAAGRQAVLVALALRNRVKTVVLMNPGVPPSYLDVVIAPVHDQLEGNNVIATQGAIHGITIENLIFPKDLEKFQSPRIGVLLGGNSIHGKYTNDLAIKMANDFRSFIGLNTKFSNASLIITPSRRTPPGWLEIFEEHLSDLPYWIWDQKTANPYPHFLKGIDIVIVCEDSISMASEACVTGKPVLIYPTGISKPKFKRFHQQLVDNGYAQKFNFNPNTDKRKILKELDRVVNELEKFFPLNID